MLPPPEITIRSAIVSSWPKARIARGKWLVSTTE